MLRIIPVLALLVASPLAAEETLFAAASHGDQATVERLLANGVAVDTAGRNAETPLIAAALAGQAEIAKVLIDHGAEVMARNKGG